MIIERLRETLARDEGCVLTRYQDSLGIDTIGYGCNLEEELPSEILDYLGVADEDDIQVLSQEQANYILDYHINESVADCSLVLGEEVWDNLSSLRQEVLVNMRLNLGPSRYRGFRKMNNAVAAGDFDKAAGEILDSKAAKQTGERYNRLASAMRTNDEMSLALDNIYGEQATTPPEDPVKLTEIDSASLLYELARRLGCLKEQNDNDDK